MSKDHAQVVDGSERKKRLTDSKKRLMDPKKRLVDIMSRPGQKRRKKRNFELQNERPSGAKCPIEMCLLRHVRRLHLPLSTDLVTVKWGPIFKVKYYQYCLRLWFRVQRPFQTKIITMMLLLRKRHARYFQLTTVLCFIEVDQWSFSTSETSVSITVYYFLSKGFHISPMG